ncbi:MAG: cytochrome c biogenesis protein CcsA [Candidatus Omnitrophica bacterium]|nr:cytochrome c biogenesis protein CcsA [Candidatus Omnitrophota bacterium]
MSPLVLLHIICALLSYAAFLAAFVSGILFLIQERQLKRKHMGVLFHRLPSLEHLDRVNFVSISAGFGLLSCGAILGFVGAGVLLGRWWTGDPKEILTVALWGAYCVLWLVRLRATLRGRRVAILSILGFTLVLFTFLGASWLLPSLHPYL